MSELGKIMMRKQGDKEWEEFGMNNEQFDALDKLMDAAFTLAKSKNQDPEKFAKAICIQLGFHAGKLTAVFDLDMFTTQYLTGQGVIAGQAYAKGELGGEDDAAASGGVRDDTAVSSGVEGRGADSPASEDGPPPGSRVH